MKASDKPQLTKKWWVSEKPADVKGADLEKALAAVEKSLSAAKSKCDGDTIDTCLGALRDLGDTVDRTIKKELDKKKHKDCISVLEKYEDLIQAEVERLEDAKADLASKNEHGEAKDEGEDDEG